MVSGEEWPAAFVFGSFRAESPTQSGDPCPLPSPPPPEPELLLLHSRFRQHLHAKAENSEGARESGGVGVPLGTGWRHCRTGSQTLGREEREGGLGGASRKGRHPALWVALGRTTQERCPLLSPRKWGGRPVAPASFSSAPAGIRTLSSSSCWCPMSQQWAQQVLTNWRGQEPSSSTVPPMGQRGGGLPPRFPS